MAKKAVKKRKADPIEKLLDQQPLGHTFLKKWRKASGLSQDELGAKLGVSDSTVSQIENGKTGYSQAYIEALGRLWGVHPCDLLTRDPADPGGVWALWAAASDDQRRQIVGMIEGFLKSSVA